MNDYEKDLEKMPGWLFMALFCLSAFITYLLILNFISG